MSQGLRQVTVSNAPQVRGLKELSALKVTSSATTAGMRALQAPGFEKPYKGSIVLPSRSGKRIHVQSFCLNKEVAVSTSERKVEKRWTSVPDESSNLTGAAGVGLRG